MCGIVGCAGRVEAVDVLLDGLSNLEYRGYDSAGVAVGNGDLTVVKRAGELEQLRTAVAERTPVEGSVGVGHTRWSTHGRASERNAHPHTDESGRVAVVHNGIVENHEALRADLAASGATFTSETDTEVVPHLVARELDDGAAPDAAFRAAVDRLEGSYALAAVLADADAVFAARADSPLVVGLGDGATYLASDVPAFLDRTREVVYLDDGEFATLRPDGVTVTDEAGDPVERSVHTVDWSPEQTGKSGYEHFMLKEIHEQPTALRQCLSGRTDDLSGSVVLPDLEDVGAPSPIQFVACGTSYHAALFGARLLRDAGRPAQVFLASEYASGPPPVPREGLVVGVTQSGETADTLGALREAGNRGAPTLAVTNVVGSTAARECDRTLYVRAGPEIGVAATKTFSAQVVALTLLAEQLAGAGESARTRRLVAALRRLPDRVQAVLDDTAAPAVARRYADRPAYFFVGRGLCHPVALEGALKFKEVTYEHAEGFAAGELKHGPLALVTPETPVFAVVVGDGAAADKTVSNVKEIEARGAPVVAVTDGASGVQRYADATLAVPGEEPRTAAVLANVQLQLLAYHAAVELDRPIDKPRNLAKSVTVE